MSNKEHKTVSATTRGIIISFRDVNKHKYVPYNAHVERKQLYNKPLGPVLFNSVQDRLFTRTVYGLGAYTTQELKTMSPKTRSHVIRRYARTKAVITRLKDDFYEQNLLGMLKQIFHHSPLMQSFCTKSEPIISQVLNDQTIAQALVKEGLLPKNFFQLA